MNFLIYVLYRVHKYHDTTEGFQHNMRVFFNFGLILLFYGMGVFIFVNKFLFSDALLNSFLSFSREIRQFVVAPLFFAIIMLPFIIYYLLKKDKIKEKFDKFEDESDYERKINGRKVISFVVFSIVFCIISVLICVPHEPWH